MKFHEYKTFKSCIGEAVANVKTMSSKEFYGRILKHVYDTKNPTRETNACLFEGSWTAAQRPFYQVYPAVIKCLQRTSLKIRPSQIGGPIGPLAITFPIGHEPRVSNGKVASILIQLTDNWTNELTGETHDTPSVRVLMDRIDSDNRRCFSDMCFVGDDYIDEAIADDIGDRKILLSLMVGIVLLANDPRFAEPILLQRDAGKEFATPEDKQRAIERAIRNGRNGIAIGKDIEVSPHCRRPHFGIRWTEKGRSVPRLVPINGCLVNRTKLFPIPTGHLGDEDS